MDKQRHWLAGSLRWLGALWLVGWALYVSYGDGRLMNSNAGMWVALAALLIPVAFAIAISWALDRYPTLDRKIHLNPSLR